jgi:hypothetical protein
MPKSNGKHVPAVRPADVSRAVRRWWKLRSVEAMAGETSMLQAMTDLHYTALAHLMRQMTSKDTSDAVKTQIALAMSPRLNAEFRGKLSDRDGARRREAPGVAGDSVMDAYKVRVTSGGR